MSWWDRKFKKAREGGVVFGTGVQATTADLTLDEQDHIILVDASGGAVTVTLPASPLTGQQYQIKSKDSTNTVTVARNSKNIDGTAADLTLLTHEAVRLIYDGTEWWIL